MHPFSSETFESEQSLIDSLRTGSQEALAALYDAYAPALFGILLKMLGKREISEGILYLTFVKIHQEAKTWEVQQGNLLTRMIKMAREEALEVIRSQIVKQEDTNKNFSTFEIANGDKGIVLGEDSTIIASSHLSNSTSLALSLIYLKGRTCEQVAKELSIPLNILHLQVRRELKEIRRFCG